MMIDSATTTKNTGLTLTEYWHMFQRELSTLYNSLSKTEIDKKYLSCHNIGMQMATIGEKIEDANLYHKYKLAQKLEALIAKLPTNGLPDITSPATLAIAKIFLSHAKRCAEGHVYSEQFLININLGKHQQRAQSDVNELEKRIAIYHNKVTKYNNRQESLHSQSSLLVTPLFEIPGCTHKITELDSPKNKKSKYSLHRT
tara:strand:- start:46040 stop:46639 length:600 start_codon:yes stop_codon:yes gene_type:complete